MKVKEIIEALVSQDPEAEVVLNIWTTDPVNTTEGDTAQVVAVSAGVAIKGDEIA